MVDPTRRKPRPAFPPSTPPALDSDDVASFVVRSFNPKSPGHIDFAEFAEGRGNVKSGTGGAMWKKGYRGRPQLMSQLLPVLRRRCRQYKLSSLRHMRVSIRFFWRWLDEIDNVEGLRIDEVSNISSIHGTLFLRSNVQASTYNTIKSVLEDAIELANATPAYWPPTPEVDPGQTNLPASYAVKAVYGELKRNVFEALRRWEAGATLGLQGTNWAGIYRARTSKWLDEDIYATVRGIIQASDDPLPGGGVVKQYLSTKNAGVFPKSFPPAKEIYANFYPMKFDACNFLYLFMARTGWNAEVVLEIDVSGSDWFAPHPTSPDHVIIHAPKDRANSVQGFPSRTKGAAEPYNLILLLKRITEPLRKKVVKELKIAREKLRLEPTNQELFEKVAELKRSSRSPFLFCDAKEIGLIKSLSQSNYHTLQGARSSWGAIVDSYNIRTRASRDKAEAEGMELKPAVFIPDSITSSDLRDAYISHAYAVSGYSWLMAQYAAGHKSVRTVQRYLRQRQWRAHGEKRVVSVTEAFWSEVKVHKRVEPAILRAMVERGEVTEEQCQRWLSHKDRTRMGTGCKDNKNPPRSIAPKHILGTGCRPHRCVLCEHAVVFDDSLSDLARRMAELEYLYRQLSLTSWNESSFPLEMATLEATLQEFDGEAVKEALDFWRAAILDGSHIVFDIDGTYEG